MMAAVSFKDLNNLDHHQDSAGKPPLQQGS